MARRRKLEGRPRPDPRPVPGARPAAPSRARLWAFRLFTAVAVPALLLGLLEGGLRVADFGHPAGFTVPCRVAGQEARCENPDFTAPFFPPGLGRNPTSFVIPRAKPPGTFRIFILGESAAQGDPEPAFGFGRFLQAMLEAAFPAERFEVVNTGIPAISSHVILPIARDVAPLGADLFVVYAGNNEVVGPFGAGTVLRPGLPSLALVRAAVAIRSTRVGQLLDRALRLGRGSRPPREWGGMEMFLGQREAADAPGLQRVYADFRANLRDILRVAAGSGAPVIVSTVGTRLRDFAPFASLHRAGLPAAALREWEAAFDRGAALEAAGRCPEALAAWDAAARIDPDHAELAYRRARCLWRSGDEAGAAVLFRRARDLDALRFRADGRIEAVIREVAAAAGPRVRLVDGEAALDGAGGGAPGARLFYEHVHPTPEGNRLLAAALFPAVVAALPPAVRAANPGAAPAPAEACAARLALTGFDRYRVAREVLARLARPPFTLQSDHAEQVAQVTAERDQGAREEFGRTEEAYRAAIARSPDDPWLRFDHAQLLDTRDVWLARRGGTDAGSAIPEYRRVLALLPRFPLAHLRLAEALARTGRPDEAVAQCRALLAFRPRDGQAYLTMANALAVAGRLGEAVEANRRAAALDAGSAEEAVRWTNAAARRLREAGQAAAARAMEQEAERLEDGLRR